MTIEAEDIEVVDSFQVRREIVHSSGPAWDAAVQVERERRAHEGPPGETRGGEEEAIERWLDPEPVDRSLVRQGLWEMEQHYWQSEQCCCGFPLMTEARFEVMRAHKEDVLARMLGLTIRPESPGE